jgi:hypothetical protein
MKLNTQYSDDVVEVLGIDKIQEFGFSKDAEEMIFTMFTKNIYSNPIGSVVREITSNCFDSHKEAGVDTPVILKLTKENNETYISFIDNGVGMSRERITNVYAQYFNSTKRNDNNQIGGFGIGGKTPLAYAESFFLITRYNGTKYTYSVRKGKKSPVIDMLDKEKTDERNGTIVKIPVRSSDVMTFEREIVRQLYYFENVIFEGFSPFVKNDYKIIEGNNFLYRGQDYNPYMHICLGRVAYPIDFNVFSSGEIDASDWYVPVAIKLEIGEINVTASRESIDYNEATKKLIKKKMELAKEELLTMLEKQHEKLNTLEEFYLLEDNPHRLILTENFILNVNSLTQNSRYKKPVLKKLNALSVPSQAEVIHMFYDVSMLGKKKKRDSTWDKSLKSVSADKVYFLTADEDMPRKKNAYMKHNMKHFYAIRRSELTISQVKSLVKRVTPDRSNTPSKVIFQQFRELQREVFGLVEAKTKKYSSVVVPTGFTVTSKYDPLYELPISFVGNYGWDRQRHLMTDLESTKATFYYGTSDDETYIREYDRIYDKLFNPQNTRKFAIKSGQYNVGQPIHFVMIAKSNLKYIAELKNFKPVKTAAKLFYRKRETVLKHIEMKMFMNQFDDLSDLFMNHRLFNVIDSPYAKTIIELKAIKKKYDLVSSNKMELQFGEGTVLNQLLCIDLKKIKFNGIKHMDVVREKTEKNGMLKHVSISSDFDPADIDYYGEKEIADIIQLLKLAYVK